MTTTSPGRPDRRMLGNCIDEVTEVVATIGLASLADDLDALAKAKGGATVVVVGEIKQGKSSLINALIGERALLPIDAEVRTATRLVVVGGDEPAAEAMIEKDDGGLRTESIDVHDIASYAAVEQDGDEGGGERSDRAAAQRVRSVTVAVPAALFTDGLVALDTPGLHSAEHAAHDEVTRASLAMADALVFVTRADSPLKESEVDFLVEAAERIDHVIFVLTMIDDYPDWRSVAEEDRQRVADRAARFADAPWVAVSAKHHLDALDLERRGEGDRATRLRSLGNIDALEQVLRTGVLDRVEELRAANLERALCGVLAQVEHAADRRRHALIAPDGAESERHDLAVQAATLNEAESLAKAHMSRELEALRQSVRADVTTLGSEVRVAAVSAAASLPADQIGDIVDIVEPRVDAGFADLQASWQQKAESIADRGLALVHAHIDELPESQRRGLDLVRAVPPPGALPQLDNVDGTQFEDAWQAAFPGLLIAATGKGWIALAAAKLGYIGAAFTTATAVFWPLAIGVGISAGLYALRRKKRVTVAARREATRWADEFLRDFESAAIRAGEEQMAAATAAIQMAFRARIAAQRSVIESTQRELERQQVASASERRILLAQADAMIEKVVELRSGIGCPDVSAP